MLLHAILLLWGSLAIADAAPCNADLIKGPLPFEIKPTAGTGPNTVKSFKCSDPEKQLEHGDKLYASIECEEGSAWKGNGVGLADSSTDLHVKCVPKACHVSLITGISATLPYTTKKLTCNVDSLEYTEGVDKKLTGHLECDDGTNFWKLEDGSDTALPADAPITVACVEKACHKSLITGYDPSRMDHPLDTLTCTQGVDTLVKYTVGGVEAFTSSLKCDAAATYQFWEAEGAPTSVSSDALITVACVKKACHESLVTVPDASVRNGLTLQCPASTPDLIIDNNSAQRFEQLTCDEGTGWTAASGPQPGKLAEDKFSVTCVASLPRCQINPANAKFTLVSKELKCADDHHALEGSTPGTLYATIKCDLATGWQSEDGTVNFGLATDQPTVTCVDYCPAPLTGLTVSPAGISQPGVFTAACPGAATEVLFYDGKKVEEGQLECTLADKWKMNGADLTSPLECKKACQSFQHKNAVETLEDGLPAEADQPIPDPDDASGVIIKCKELNFLKEGDTGKNSITINEKDVFSHLKCNPTRGFTDVYDNQIESDPFEKAHIECVRSKCSKGTSTFTCKVIENDHSAINAEYECPSVFSPYSIADDPNLLKCSEKQILYEATTNKFYKSPPQCTTDGTWQARDDDKTLIVDGSQVFCLQKRCNKCDTIAPTSAQAGDPLVFTPGTREECAKVTCQNGNDLWYVKDSDGNTKQYAGEVVCSSAKDSEKKWLIDGKTPIVEASCIPAADQANVECTVAAPVITTCKSDWKSMGCDPLPADPLPDTGATECLNGKNMYHMQRGESGFLEGGKKIECDKTKGTWAITDANGGPVDELKRKGTVVCADSNPQPITTTAAPTTTTPFVKPCVACPQFRDIMYTCATCSKKDSDVQIMDKQDEDKCIAQILDGKIETEKAGEVDKLVCDKNEKIWKTENGTEAGKFAAFQAAEQPSSAMTYIVAGSVGAVVFLIIVFAVIFKVFVAKKKPEDKEEETKRKTLLEEAKKKKKQKAGDNDEILDDVVVDSPSELKL